jgi:hypothetical protein
MNNEDRNRIIIDLFLHKIPEEELLQQFGIGHSDGARFGLSILEEAYGAKDVDSVECGLGLGFRFGMSVKFFDILVKLSDADWHYRHEDVVTALDELHDGRTVETLYRAALKRHSYLDYDDSRALTVKAIFALGNLGDAAADGKLRLLAESGDSVVRVNARKQLYRRSAAITPEEREGTKVLCERIDREGNQEVRAQLLQQLAELNEKRQAAEDSWMATQGWESSTRQKA